MFSNKSHLTSYILITVVALCSLSYFQFNIQQQVNLDNGLLRSALCARNVVLFTYGETTSTLSKLLKEESKFKNENWTSIGRDITTWTIFFSPELQKKQDVDFFQKVIPVILRNIYVENVSEIDRARFVLLCSLPYYEDGELKYAPDAIPFYYAINSLETQKSIKFINELWSREDLICKQAKIIDSDADKFFPFKDTFMRRYNKPRRRVLGGVIMIGVSLILFVFSALYAYRKNRNGLLLLGAPFHIYLAATKYSVRELKFPLILDAYAFFWGALGVFRTFFFLYPAF